MSSLPSTWLQTTLGAVVDYGATEKAEPEDIGDGTWVLELEDIEKESSKIIQKLTYAERQSKSTKNRFSAGDVLYGKLRPYLNKVVLATAPGVCTTEIIPIKPNAIVHGAYLYHWLRHPKFLAYVTEVSHGVNMPRLGTEAGRAAPFVLAPKAEQKRIADKLDTVLARVDACRDRLDRIPTILKRFRQSVLAAATSGQLTADWRAQGTAKPISIESAMPDNKNRPDNWFIVKVEKVASVVDPHPSHRTPPEVKDGIPYVGIGDFDESGAIRFQSVRRVSSAILQEHRSRYQIRVGDFIFGKIGTIGRPTKLTADINFALSANVLLIQPNHAYVDSEFVYLLFSSPGFQSSVMDNSSATSQAAFGIKKMRNTDICLPPKNEQIEIVRRVETLFAFADRLEARVTAARESTDRLTPALLAKAFRGELVPQDPNDEPAAEPLKRLAADNTTTTAKAKRGKKAQSVGA